MQSADSKAGRPWPLVAAVLGAVAIVVAGLVFVAQRTLYLAEEALVLTQLAEQANRVTLYKALGGGWQETGP